MKIYPSKDFLNEILKYDSNSGQLFWKRRDLNLFKDEKSCKVWNTRYSNKLAGTKIKVKNSTTLYYIQISINDKLYRAHMIIWIMLYGKINGVIDHIDGDGLNNRLINLRDINQSKNIRKSKIRKNNNSGIIGVSLTSNNKFKPTITKNGKTVHFGRYDDKDYAARIYVTAVVIISGENFNKHQPFSVGSKEYIMVENKLKLYK